MTQLVFHHNHKLLPPASEDLLPVQLYGSSGRGRGDISVVGNSVIDKVKRLRQGIPGQVMDFLTIALAVTAADTFVRRANTDDGWTRQFSIRLPLYKPARWLQQKKNLESVLHFLSGDKWDFDFQEGGCPPPTPFRRASRAKLVQLRGLDCVSLFSGGLDSAVGVIDLFAQGRAPLLVSHAYRGDKKHQDKIAQLLQGEYSRFEMNADPRWYSGIRDVTMRTRSLNFLAFAAVGACAVQAVSQQDQIDLFVPENGFISLNAPLTNRRIGTLSTRTTHPHFMAGIRNLSRAVGIPCRIVNPYQFRTKGQMASECQNRRSLENIVGHTVSCSRWKRSNQQCGVCVPCIIRRAALRAAGISDGARYTFDAVADVLNQTDRRDDLMALSIAVTQKATRKLGPWILDSGPLPPAKFKNFQNVFLDGLNEVEDFLRVEGAL